MPDKKDLRLVAVVTAGVMLAGFIMYQFRDVSIIDQSRNGFGG